MANVKPHTTLSSDLDLVVQGQKFSPCPIPFSDQYTPSPPPKNHLMASSSAENNIGGIPEWKEEEACGNAAGLIALQPLV